MTYFTDSALAANIITPYEADLIEDFIDETLNEKIDAGIFIFTPPAELKPLWDRVCLFRCGGKLQ
jgi:hypothetical protein